MADRALYTNDAALTEANAIGLSLADSGASPSPIESKVRLFDDTLIPTVNTVKADLVAAEIALTGYPVGGYDVTDFAGAKFAPGGGAVILSNMINVEYASGTPAVCGGYWLEDPAGKVREVFIYDPVRPLAAVGDGFPIVVQLGYGRNG